jgi:transposase
LIRHLPVFDKPVYLRITPIRYRCENCDDGPTTTEQYDWCDRNASITKGLEEYLMRSLIHSTIEDVSKKEEIGYQYSPTLKQAHHHCALQLTHIFNTHSSRKSGVVKINRWIKAVSKSDLRCFDGFIKTREKNKGHIANYFKGRKNSGFVEGLNNKIKVAKRRCYGLFKTEPMFQRLFLDLQGYEYYA